MKKGIITICILIVASAGAAFAQGSGQLSTTTGGPSAVLPRPSPFPRVPIVLVPKEGVVQVAIRNRNPLQLLNPKAPAQYGDGQEHVARDPDDPAKPKGIAFFAWTF